MSGSDGNPLSVLHVSGQDVYVCRRAGSWLASSVVMSTDCPMSDSDMKPLLLTSAFVVFVCVFVCV